MTTAYENILVKERASLLNQYARAKQQEKADILVRLMDIDELLEAQKKEPSGNGREHKTAEGIV